MGALVRKLGPVMLAVLVSGTAVVRSGEVESTGKNAIYFNKTGWELLKKNDTFRAILNFKQALQRNPNYRDALIGLGRAYLHTEAYDESVKLFEKALRLDKNSSEAMIGMGFAMSGTGRFNDALSHFESAIKISNDNIDAYYGIAALYHGMGKDLWARRKLDAIFRINPYHYDSLLLMAELKSQEKRYDEARSLVEKALNADPEKPDGYVKYGKIQLTRYMKTGDGDYLSDAVTEFNNALGKQSNSFPASRYLGFISLLKGEYTAAIEHFKRAQDSFPNNIIPRYNLAVAYEKGGDLESAYKAFSGVYRLFPYDSLLQSRFEDFLVENEFKSGNPSRVLLSEKHFEKAGSRMKISLSDQAMFHLRRSILLNPLRKEARHILKEYYLTQDYYRFYVNELKDLARIFPEDGYQEILNVAVIKRRERLYHRTGFSQEEPQRDVPNVLVLDFNPEDTVSPHFDAGRVIANQLSFALQQFGRMSSLGVRERKPLAGFVFVEDDYLEKNMEKISELVRDEKLPKIDFVIYGSYQEGNYFLSTNFKILNFKNGVVIGDFYLSESGHDNLQKLVLRAARRIYEFIPYEGRVLKIDENDVIVNLGLFDGVGKDDLLVLYKNMPHGESRGLSVKSKIILKVTESDTVIASARPVKEGDITGIELNDAIYPLQKRRAKKIE
jgi:tetratricopeptide (TPR) repeat protein